MLQRVTTTVTACRRGLSAGRLPGVRRTALAGYDAAAATGAAMRQMQKETLTARLGLPRRGFVSPFFAMIRFPHCPLRTGLLLLLYQCP